MDVAETIVSNIDDDISSYIYEMRGLLQSLEEQLGQCDSKVKPNILTQLTLLRNSLASLVIPKEIELPAKGSIKQVQAHVTMTRLGHGMPIEASGTSKERYVVSDLSPAKAPTTGVLRRKHQRGRSHVRF